MRVAYRFFWPGFDSNNNIFTSVLRLGYENIEVVAVHAEPDLIIQSVFGLKSEHLGVINAVTYIGEPIAAQKNWGTTLGFDINREHEGHFYLPLYLLQFSWLDSQKCYGNPSYRIPIHSLYRSRAVSFTHLRDIFFSCVFNHDPSNNRFSLLRRLVDRGMHTRAYGKPFGNGGFPDKKKLEIYGNSTYVMAFESREMEGYQTEKLVHAYFAGAVPVTWGWTNPNVNQEAIVNANSFETNDNLIDFLIANSADEISYRKIYNQPLFEKNPTLDSVAIPILSAVRTTI